MSHNLCPACGAEIAAAQINIAEGVALCPACGQLSHLAEVANTTRPVTEIVQRPPQGCSVSDHGQEIVVYATARSLGKLLPLLAFTLFWNSIVSVFVLIAAAGLVAHMIGPLPEWFPAPNNGEPMPLGVLLFLCLFLVPFVGVGAVMAAATLMCLAGKVEAHIGDSEAQVRTGIGPFVWRRRFDPGQAARVTIGYSSWKTNGQHEPLIVIEADQTVKFGSLLSEQRREWMRAVLQMLLAEPASGRRQLALSLGSQQL